jgi:cyclic beta-1,2-glucan synthetase
VRRIGAHLFPAGPPPPGQRAPRPPGGSSDGASIRVREWLRGLVSGGDYEISVDRNRVPPAPWANVIANARGGFLVTERGGGCAWARAATSTGLTPWHNDP